MKQAKSFFAVSLWLLFFSANMEAQQLEILGPDQVVENSSAQYQAILHNADGSTLDVTSSAVWSVIPDTYASMAQNGVLTTQDIEKFENAILAADYTEEETNFQAEKPVTLFAICPSGSALQFDGTNDYVDLPDGFSDFSNGLTIMVWAYPTASKNWARFVDLGNGQANNNILFFRGGTSRDLLFEVYRDSSGGWLIAANTIELDRWQHFAVTQDSTGKVIIYKNGQPIRTGTIKIPKNVIRTQNYIGRSNWSTIDEYYQGQMDDVRIFNRVLSQSEIIAGMNIQVTNDSHLIAYWNFDEGAGQMAGDSTQQYNGLLGSTADADDADPQWVESEAPVGICSSYILAVQDLKSALTGKLKMLDDLETALEKEQHAMDNLKSMIGENDLGDLTKEEVYKAIADVRLAMVQQKISRFALRISVMRLEDALRQIGVEVESHPWPDIPKPKYYHPADINQDDQINLLDLAIISENWLRPDE